MPNPENIEKHKWQPGQSGNPSGRRKGSLNSKTILARWLGVEVKTKHPVTKQEIEVPAEEAIIIAVIGQAMKGNVHAFNALLDRYEGKVNQRMELTGQDGGPILTETPNSIDYSKLPTDVLKALVAARKTNREGEYAKEKDIKAQKGTTRKSTNNKKK